MAKTALRRKLEAAYNPSTFHAWEYAQGPHREYTVLIPAIGLHEDLPMCDATDKYLAVSGELLKAAARRAKSLPRVKISVADKQYDKSRAMGYCEAITGRRPDTVFWDHCNGENRPRVRACLFRHATYGFESWEIPNWDWDGHNQTVDDCRLDTDIDIFA